jgi:hypothetical protein
MCVKVLHSQPTTPARVNIGPSMQSKCCRNLEQSAKTKWEGEAPYEPMVREFWLRGSLALPVVGTFRPSRR